MSKRISIAENMQAIAFAAPGGPEALAVYEVPSPHPGPGEVRLRVHTAAVNPTDTLLRSGVRPMADKQPPYIVGMDAAGVIDEVGEGTPWKIGDEVMAIAMPLGPHGGAYAEYLVSPWQSIARIPSGTSFAAASTLPMNGLTALLILDTLKLAPGQTLAVTGAAGTLGSYLIPLAKRDGLVVVADAAHEDKEHVSNLGADFVVERGSLMAEEVRTIFPGGVHALADLAAQNETAMAAVSDDGQFATVRAWEGMGSRNISVHRILVYDYYREQAKLDHLRQMAEDRILTLRVAKELPASRAPEAHQQLEAGGIRGRIVLNF